MAQSEQRISNGRTRTRRLIAQFMLAFSVRLLSPLTILPVATVATVSLHSDESAAQVVNPCAAPANEIVAAGEIDRTIVDRRRFLASVSAVDAG